MASTTPARTRTRQAATARRTTAVARRPAPTTLAAAAPAFEPIRLPANDEVSEDRIPIFYIGDTEYTVPAVIPAGVALEYLRISAAAGPDAAAGVILTRVLGEEAYTALEQARGLTGDQLMQIVQLVVDQALGALEQEGEEGKAG